MAGAWGLSGGGFEAGGLGPVGRFTLMGRRVGACARFQGALWWLCGVFMGCDSRLLLGPTSQTDVLLITPETSIASHSLIERVLDRRVSPGTRIIVLVRRWQRQPYLEACLRSHTLEVVCAWARG